MSPWNALPWNTILIIIGISLFITSLLTVIFIKVRRFEDLGLIIGVFLVFLSLFSYFYLIPNEIINEAILPENYIWEDTGNVRYWERNSVFLKENDKEMTNLALGQLLPKRTPIVRNFTGKEVIHAVSYDKEKNQMFINDVIYDENNEIFTVINGNEKVSEWYYINPRLSSLEYVNVDGGYWGIPSNNQFISNIKVGWVESHSLKEGNQNVVLVRDMHKIKTGVIDGVEVSVWQSDIFNLPIKWHGKSYVCDETLQLIVHQKTGYIVHVYRNLMLYAHMSQFIELYYPNALKNRIVSRYLSINDPIGEAAELIYDTTDASQAIHIAEIKSIEGYMNYVPILICFPMFLIGAALTWRYWGRSYYWKRYKDFEQKGSFQEMKRKKSYKKIIAFGIIFIIVFSSIGYIFFTNIDKKNEITSKIEQNLKELTFEPEPPTPPGTQRLIDSGRHVVQLTDEGIHRLSRREWWYFNVFFNDPDSDLYGYSLVVSFNKMKFFDIRFLRPDNLFIILFDDSGMNYEFNTLNKKRGTLKAASKGVDVSFEDSWVRGSYPFWQIHVINNEKGFVADLDFFADFQPVWVEGRSANLALASLLTGGDYYIPRGIVTGNITWNEKQYQVSGMGYHDHVWQPIVPRWVSKGWDWANLHFDNGWEMYVSKFILRTPFKLSFDSIIVSPNNRNITEFNHFDVKYIETKNIIGMPFLKYPKKIHVYAKQDDMILDLNIEIYNTYEGVFKIARTGMFEGPCIATGTFSWSGHTVELNGYGMSEITRVKYIIELPGIIPKIIERLSIRR